MKFPTLLLLLLVMGLFATVTVGAQAADKHVLLVAGNPSHGPGQHEHNAGVQLLAKCLAGVPGLKVDVLLNSAPAPAGAIERADAVIIFSDGGLRHVMFTADYLARLDALAARGGGIGLLHYAVEPAADKGQPEVLRWIGGAFEINWSVNPHWTPRFQPLPSHPITRGVKPFTLQDEWYFNLRFAGNQAALTPLLVAVPPAETMARKDDPHAGNPQVRAAVAAGKPQTVAWAFERPGGGHGFGFTGAHFHQNWGDENFRKLVLNAIVWLAKVDVPAGGIVSTVTPEDLQAHLDVKPAPKPKAAEKK